MSGISNLTAAQLSQASYIPLSNFTNGTNLPPIGWNVAINQSFTVGPDQFVTFINTATQQVVITFKGSNNIDNIANDLANSGASDYSNIVVQAGQALSQIKSLYPGYQIMTDGHSLGGGMAQTFAVQNGLSGYGQNSLPIAAGSIQADPNFSAELALWRGSQGFSEVNTYGDPATTAYSTIQGQLYLDTSPLEVWTPAIATEIVGAELNIGSPLLGLPLMAYGAYQAHSINSVVSALLNGTSFASLAQFSDLLASNSSQMLSAVTSSSPLINSSNAFVGVTTSAGVNYTVTPTSISSYVTDYTISPASGGSSTIAVITPTTSASYSAATLNAQDVAFLSNGSAFLNQLSGTSVTFDANGNASFTSTQGGWAPTTTVNTSGGISFAISGDKLSFSTNALQSLSYNGTSFVYGLSSSASAENEGIIWNPSNGQATLNLTPTGGTTVTTSLGQINPGDTLSVNGATASLLDPTSKVMNSAQVNADGSQVDTAFNTTGTGTWTSTAIFLNGAGAETEAQYNNTNNNNVYNFYNPAANEALVAQQFLNADGSGEVVANNITLNYASGNVATVTMGSFGDALVTLAPNGGTGASETVDLAANGVTASLGGTFSPFTQAATAVSVDALGDITYKLPSAGFGEALSPSAFRALTRRRSAETR